MHGLQDHDDPWKEPHLYTVSLEADGTQCIAPTKKNNNRRCKLGIGDTGGVSEAAALYAKIVSSTEPQEIRKQVREFVLLRCCRKWHRDKLGAKAECRSTLADLYIAALTAGRLLQVDVPTGEHSLDDKDFDESTIRPRYTDPKLLLLDLLRRDVDLYPLGERALPKLGHIYVLTLDKHPGIFKIGYSGVSAASRCSEWAKCLGEASVLAEKLVPYPERMEQLIHLQLRDHRRQIVTCKQCNVSHIELFEITKEVVVQVLDDWDSIIRQEPLYDDTQCLTSAWAVMLEAFDGEPTPKTLLELLAATKKEAVKLAVVEEEAAILLKLETSRISDTLTDERIQHSAGDDALKEIKPEEHHAPHEEQKSAAAAPADTSNDRSATPGSMSVVSEPASRVIVAPIEAIGHATGTSESDKGRMISKDTLDITQEQIANCSPRIKIGGDVSNLISRFELASLDPQLLIDTKKKVSISDSSESIPVAA